ncbi:MAG: hypothetical protein PHE51_05815 [Eubacteriales bacterium]|nr:hypothetical protein [Eubacteriales bacterium]
MAYRRYYSPFENEVRVDPQRIPAPPPPPPPKKPRRFRAPRIPTLTYPLKEDGGFLGGIQLDDLVIIGLIMLLIFEDGQERDMPLIIGLGALLLSEFWES